MDKKIANALTREPIRILRYYCSVFGESLCIIDDGQVSSRGRTGPRLRRAVAVGSQTILPTVQRILRRYSPPSSNNIKTVNAFRCSEVDVHVTAVTLRSLHHIVLS